MAEFDPLLEWLGIPPDRRPADFYTLLGLRRFEDDKLLILQAVQVRQLVVQPHLRGPHAKQAEKILALLAEAQACLLDPKRKAAYDERLRAVFPAGMSSTADPCPESAGTKAAQEVRRLSAEAGPSTEDRPAARSTSDGKDEYPLAEPLPPPPDLSDRRHLRSTPPPVPTATPRSTPRGWPPRSSFSPDLVEYAKLIGLAAVAILGILLIGLLIYRLDSAVYVATGRPSGQSATASAGEGAARPNPTQEGQTSNAGSLPPLADERELAPKAEFAFRPEQKLGDQPPPAVFFDPPRPAGVKVEPIGAPAPLFAPADAPAPPAPAEKPADNAGDPNPPAPGEEPPPPQEGEVDDSPPAVIELPKPKITDRKTAEALLRAAGASTKARLDALANDVRFASEMLLLYEAFLDAEGIAEEEKEKARQYLPMWQKRAADGLVRLGEMWLVPAEWKSRKHEARGAFKRGMMLLGRSDQAVIREFEKASRLDPEFVSADFVLGLLYAIAGPRFYEARQCFRRCVQRKKDHLAAWNNLALTELRNRAPASALSAFRKAVELGGNPAVTHNIKVVLLADNTKVFPLAPNTARSFADLYTKAAEIAPEAELAKGGTPKGFIFLPPSTDLLIADGLAKPPGPLRGPSPNVQPAQDLIPTGFGSGFVVAPNFIVTNRHVVDESELFGIIPHQANKPVALAHLELLHEDPDVDLALLRCETWSAPPLHLRDDKDYLPAGSTVALLGFPVPEILGAELKVTQGIISASPERGREILSGRYLIDIRSNPGNSGGPVVDQTGRVVAVHVGRIALPMSFAMAEPAQRVLELLEKAGVGRPAGPVDPPPRELTEIFKDAEKSVVLIQCLSKPVSLAMSCQKAGVGFLDSWCLRCNGEGWVDCPNPRCGNGSISTTRERLLGHDPMTGRPIIVREPTTVPCRDCGAKGKVTCPVCNGSRTMR